MAKKRPKISQGYKPKKLDEQVNPIKVEAERKRQRRRDLARGAYDLTPELRDSIKAKSARIGIPASQFAMFLLADALKRYDEGHIDPIPFLSESTSPKFANNLDYNDEWYYDGL